MGDHLQWCGVLNGLMIIIDFSYGSKHAWSKFCKLDDDEKRRRGER